MNRVCIFGGSGSFGTAMTKRLLNTTDYEIVIFDRDEKGYLTPESVYHIFLALGEKIKLEDITNILKENDIDGDGNLNFEDFKMLMHSGLEELEKKNPNSMILNLDNYLNSPFEYNEKKYQNDDYLDYLSGLNNL